MTYAHPDVLVETPWVADHLNDPSVRLVEVDTGTAAYDSGHIPGALPWAIFTDMLLPGYRLKTDPADAEALLAGLGIGNDTTVVFYGQYAPFAFWYARLFGHRDARVLNGGRTKWIAEGRPLATDRPAIAPATYRAQAPDWSSRADLAHVADAVGQPGTLFLDVRNRREYDGELFWPNRPPEEGERAGHLPGALHLPFGLALNDDGTFKDAGTLRALYEGHDVTPDKQIIPYCTVGGRSNVTWFVLSQLLGYPDVRHYEASWYEWGRLPDTPIA